MASGPLKGIRVLEFTQIIAGPFGCMMLADQGAEVIKIEPPGGEPWRLNAQFIPGESKTYQSLNRGKQSLVLSGDHHRAGEIIRRLMPTIDVVVINYRPDVASRLGIDYQSLSALKPDLVYVDVTAFGRSGPWAHRPGYDIVVQAVSGMMAADGKLAEDGRPEQITASAVADYATGLVIAWAVTSALYHRERTGEGQLVEATLLQTALAFQGSTVMELPAADLNLRNPLREKRRALQREGASYADMLAARQAQRGGGSLYYRPYLTKNGAIALGALSRGLWAKVRRAVGTDYLGQEDPRFDLRNPEWLDYSRRKMLEVEDIMRSKTTEEWLEIFDREGVPAGAVAFPEDLSEDPQVVANQMMVDLDHDLTGPQTMVGPLLRFSKTPMEAQGASPPLGRDTDRWLRELGYTDDEIQVLRRDGVVA